MDAIRAASFASCAASSALAIGTLLILCGWRFFSVAFYRQISGAKSIKKKFYNVIRAKSIKKIQHVLSPGAKSAISVFFVVL
jgi:hypothetical protein